MRRKNFIQFLKLNLTLKTHFLPPYEWTHFLTPSAIFFVHGNYHERFFHLTSYEHVCGILPRVLIIFLGHLWTRRLKKFPGLSPPQNPPPSFTGQIANNKHNIPPLLYSINPPIHSLAQSKTLEINPPLTTSLISLFF